MIDVGLLFDLQPPAVHLPTLVCACVFFGHFIIKDRWCILVHLRFNKSGKVNWSHMMHMGYVLILNQLPKTLEKC